jgi:hypothetical protein
MNKLTVCFSIFLISLVTFHSAQANQPDELSAFLERTKGDRFHCQSGCGIILQSCYDEAVKIVNTKIKSLLNTLEFGHAPACETLAKNYLDRASTLNINTNENGATQTGWLNAELTLLFAKQKLDIVQLIQKKCK